MQESKKGRPPLSKPHRDVAIALVERDGRWLVARRLDDAHLGGLWEFPGGAREPHESAIGAALRELREECGVTARAVRVLAAARCEYEDRAVTITPVLCKWTAGSARPLGSAACAWVTPDELRGLEMPAINAAIIEAALKPA